MTSPTSPRGQQDKSETHGDLLNVSSLLSSPVLHSKKNVQLERAVFCHRPFSEHVGYLLLYLALKETQILGALVHHIVIQDNYKPIASNNWL